MKERERINETELIPIGDYNPRNGEKEGNKRSRRLEHEWISKNAINQCARYAKKLNVTEEQFIVSKVA